MVKTKMQQKNLVKQGPEWRRYDTVSFERTDNFKALSASFDMTATQPVTIRPKLQKPTVNDTKSVEETQPKAPEPTGKIVDQGKYVHVIASKSKTKKTKNPIIVIPITHTVPKVESVVSKEVEEAQSPPHAARPSSARAPVYFNLFDSVATDIDTKTQYLNERRELVRQKKKPMYQGRQIRSTSPLRLTPINDQQIIRQERTSIDAPAKSTSSVTQITLSKVNSAQLYDTTESAVDITLPGTSSIHVPSQRASFEEDVELSHHLTNTNEEIISMLQINDTTVSALNSTADMLPGDKIGGQVIDNTDMGSVPHGFSLQSNSNTIDGREDNGNRSPSPKLALSSRVSSRGNSRPNSTAKSRPPSGGHILVKDVSPPYPDSDRTVTIPTTLSPRTYQPVINVNTKLPSNGALKRNDILRGKILHPNPSPKHDSYDASQDPSSPQKRLVHFPLPRVSSIAPTPLGAGMGSAREVFLGTEEGDINPVDDRPHSRGNKNKDEKVMKPKSAKGKRKEGKKEKRGEERKSFDSLNWSIGISAELSSRLGSPIVSPHSLNEHREPEDVEVGAVVGLSDNGDDAISVLSSQEGGENQSLESPLRDLSASYGVASQYSLDAAYAPLDFAPFQVHRRIMGWKLTNPKRHKTLMDMLDVVHMQNSDSQSLRNLSKDMRLLMDQADDEREDGLTVDYDAIRRQTNAWVSSVERMIKSRSSYKNTRTIREMMSKKMAKKQQYHAVVGAVTPGQTRNAVPCYNSGFMNALERGGLSTDKKTSTSDGGYSHVLAMKAKAKEADALRNGTPIGMETDMIQRPGSPSQRLLSPLNRASREYLGNQLQTVQDIESAANKIFTYPMDINLPRGRTDILDSVNMRLSLEKEMNMHQDKKWVSQDNKYHKVPHGGQTVAFYDQGEQTKNPFAIDEEESLPDTIIPRTGPKDKERGVYSYNGTLLSTRLTKGPF